MGLFLFPDKCERNTQFGVTADYFQTFEVTDAQACSYACLE